MSYRFESGRKTHIIRQIYLTPGGDGATTFRLTDMTALSAAVNTQDLTDGRTEQTVGQKSVIDIQTCSTQVHFCWTWTLGTWT